MTDQTPPLTITQTIGMRIRLLRKSNGMTQGELASQLGITTQAVSKWERGLCAPDVAFLVCLSRIFEVTIDCLFGIA